MSNNEAVIRRYNTLLRERDHARRIYDHKTDQRLTDELLRIRPNVEVALNAISKTPEPTRSDPSPEELFLLGRVAALAAENERLCKMLTGERPVDDVYLRRVQEARARRAAVRDEWS